MVAIVIVGPSHAGKTTLLNKITLDYERYSLQQRPELADLDEKLGSGNRSNVDMAINLVRAAATRPGHIVLVNVGAGQMVQAAFREFLETEPSLVVSAVWCNESTFRLRHSAETAEREVQNNYSAQLQSLWERLREKGWLVDTSNPISEEDSARELANIIRRIGQILQAI